VIPTYDYGLQKSSPFFFHLFTTIYSGLLPPFIADANKTQSLQKMFLLVMDRLLLAKLNAQMIKQLPILILLFIVVIGLQN